MAATSTSTSTAQRALKGAVGAVIAGLSAVATAYPDGMTAQEWGTIAGAVVVGFLGAFAIPTKASSTDRKSGIDDSTDVKDARPEVSSQRSSTWEDLALEAVEGAVTSVFEDDSSGRGTKGARRR